MRVNGRLLPEGCCQLILYAVEGNVLSLPAEPNSLALNVLKHEGERATRRR